MPETFEPYGEPLPASGSSEREASRPVSAILELVGQGFFWLLVVVIVCTRVAYFSPTSLFATNAAAAHATSAALKTAQR
jgi:hypothetical protein